MFFLHGALSMPYFQGDVETDHKQMVRAHMRYAVFGHISHEEQRQVL